MAQGNRKTEDRPEEQGRVPPELERQINENLRRLYKQTLEEEVPDHLQKLLERLRKQDEDEQDQDKDRVR